MYEEDYWPQYCSDYRRLVAWVDKEGWKFAPPQRRRWRETIARALRGLASRIAAEAEERPVTTDRRAPIAR